ncbi:MAG: hypothetical protein D6689_00750 [Deltaproteobacteria bacterium]|nr:MAG: hypothetical protein D6689_00750 [Deltaproteobacteria bacterium]
MAPASLTFARARQAALACAVAAGAAACAAGGPPASPHDRDAAASYPLIVTRNGDGTVGSTPAGIDCGVQCSESYATGQQVVLTATGSFLGWSGACTGSGTVCTVVMDAPKSVTATFAGGVADAGAGGGSSCDLVAQTGCAAGQACDFDLSARTPYCRPAGAGGDLAVCAAAADCAAGFTCVSDGMGSGCLHWCALPAGAECAPFAGSTCTALQPPVAIGGTEYGVCF